MKLTEVVTGTPQERAAKQALRKFGERPPTSNHQQREFARAQKLSRQLTRRQLITGAVGGVVVAGGAALAHRELTTEYFDEGPLYEGPIEDMVGLPQVTGEDFSLMTENLSSSDIPFLQMLAVGVTNLHTATAPPQEINWMIADDALPLPITINKNSRESFAYLHFVTDTSGQHFTLHNKDNPEQNKAIYPASPAYPGIRLGAAGFDSHDIGDAILLAKEHATLAMFFQASDEAYDWITTHLGTITQANGSPIEDRIDQKRAGMTLLGDVMTQDSAQSFILDGLPIFLLTSAVQDGIAQEQLSSQILERASMTAVAGFLNDPEVNRLTREIRDGWTASGKMLPSHIQSGLLEFAFTKNPLSDAIISFWENQGYTINSE